MSERKLSLPEFAALMALAEEAGEISNLDLKQRHGLTIDGQKRRKLNELKLVDSWKQGRSYVHVLTDSGWARLEEKPARRRAARDDRLTGGSSPVAFAAGCRNIWTVPA
ncbi:hypothetical protein ACFSTC_62280 [Nonomuraea ferruginea]